MQTQPRTTDEGSSVIWCQQCGIPYAAGTAYCSDCGKELAGAMDTVPLKVEVASAPPVMPDTESSADDGDSAPEFDLDAIYPSAPTSLMGRIRQRPRPLSEDEVEAAAAMIVARAQDASASVADEAPRDVLTLLPDLLPDPVVAAALQRRREQDRKWIIAGIVCSIILIVIALVLSRTIAGGLPQR
jgi:hypothetical protein